MAVIGCQLDIDSFLVESYVVETDTHDPKLKPSNKKHRFCGQKSGGLKDSSFGTQRIAEHRVCI